MNTIVPDIITPNITLTENDVFGWSPLLVQGAIDDRERILTGHITPAEMALQLAFGIYNHNSPKEFRTSYQDFFETERSRIRRHIRGNGSHEIGYVVTIALWSDRGAIIDYPGGYEGYSSKFDGYSREFIFTNPGRLMQQLYSSLDDDYIPAFNNGCTSIDGKMNYEDELFAQKLEAKGDFEGAALIRSAVIGI